MSSILRTLLQKLQPLFTPLFVVNTAAILYLTLAPADALSDSKIWGYDKPGHALMFGGWMILLGLVQHYRYKKPIREGRLLVTSSLFGIIIEFLQLLLPFRRSFEMLDVVADIAGCLAAFFVLRYLKGRIITGTFDQVEH